MFKRILHRPALAIVLSIIVVFLGMLGIRRLPIAQFPDVAPPSVYVSIAYPGASVKVLVDAGLDGATPAFSTVLWVGVGVVLAYVLWKTGIMMLRSMTSMPPEPPPTGELRKVNRRYRCDVCGVEVKLTMAPRAHFGLVRGRKIPDFCCRASGGPA